MAVQAALRPAEAGNRNDEGVGCGHSG